MDTALRPRDIQARIRSGRTVDEVAAAAGLSADMVQRFAAPVLAEREYVAGQAMTAPVRRTGETSAHRKLRVAVSERLMSHRVDIDQVEWDSARMEDGRWAVMAAYRVQDTRHEAVFHFDVPGRFSVAGNTEARWLLGEEVDAADDEPTVDLADNPPPTVAATPQVEVAANPADQDTESGAALQAADDPVAPEVTLTVVDAPTDSQTDAAADAPTDPATGEDAAGLDLIYDILDRAGTEFTEDSVEIPVEAETAGRLAEPGEPGETREPSEWVAVPDTEQRSRLVAADYPPTAESYPVEPSLFDAEPEFTPPTPRRKGRPKVPAIDVVETVEIVDTVEIDVPVEVAAPETSESATDAPEDPPAAPAPAKKARGKRASVPSWDEIMFGSPRSSRQSKG